MAIIETKENDNLEILKTHYYKASYEQVKAVYLDVLGKMNFNIVSVDDNYNEIFAEVPHMSVTAKIIEQTPKETSIDFYVNAEYLIGSKKKVFTFIQAVYNEIAKKYEFKGLGLHQ